MTVTPGTIFPFQSLDTDCVGCEPSVQVPLLILGVLGLVLGYHLLRHFKENPPKKKSE